MSMAVASAAPAAKAVALAFVLFLTIDTAAPTAATRHLSQTHVLTPASFPCCP